jgi:uncharacterized protein (TIGR02118 family)
VIVSFSTVLRRSGSSLQEFHSYWQINHGPLTVQSFPSLRRYVQNHMVVEEGMPLLPWPSFDGCVELAFDDLSALHATFRSDAAAVTTADADEYREPGRNGRAICERSVLVDDAPEDDGFKLVTVFRKHPNCPQEVFGETLSGAYASSVRAAGPKRHEQLFAIVDGEGPPPSFEAIDLIWFDDSQSAAALPTELGPELAPILAGRVMGVERVVTRPVRIL